MMNGIWKTVVFAIVLAVIAGFVMLVANPVKPTEIIITPGIDRNNYQFGIFGAVNDPGYYESSGPLRITEALEMAGGLTADADHAHSNLAKWIDDGETVIIPTIGLVQPTLTQPVPEEEKIDLNSADISELMKLPGIGEKRARDIILLREQKGGYNSPEEILEISGISEKLLENIYDRLIVR